MNEELRALCVKAVARIHQIPFSDWGESDLLVDVLYEELSPILEGCTVTDPSSTPRRIDSAGRDVTDLPGLWEKSDTFDPSSAE